MAHQGNRCTNRSETPTAVNPVELSAIHSQAEKECGATKVPSPARWAPRSNVLAIWMHDVEKAFVVTVVFTALLTALLWAELTPFGSGPDENAHFQMDWFVASHHALPIFDVSPDIQHTICDGPGNCYASYASQPIGSPIAGGLVMNVVNIVTGIPLDDLRLPTRSVSLLSYVVYVTFLYHCCKAVLLDRMVRLTALVLGTFIPQVVYVGSYTNDDSLGMAAGSVALYLSILTLRDGLDRRKAIVAGVIFGLLGLTKINYYCIALVFVACLVAHYLLRRTMIHFGHYVRLLLLSVGVGFIIWGWWAIRQQIIYGDPLGLKIWSQSIHTVAPGMGAHSERTFGAILDTMFTSPVLLHTLMTFWGVFDWERVFLTQSPVLYVVIVALMLVATIANAYGSLRLLVGRNIERFEPWGVWLWLIFLGLGLLLWLQWMLEARGTFGFDAQGRYFFPGLIPIALFLAAGVHYMWRGKTWPSLAFGLTAFAMVGLNVYTLLVVIVPAYYHL